MVVKKETKIKNENENKYVISIYQKSHNNMLHNVKNKHQFEYGEKKSSHCKNSERNLIKIKKRNSKNID